MLVNCNWVVNPVEAVQYTFTHKQYTERHTNSTQNDTKHTIHRTTQQFRRSAVRAPPWLDLPWHLPYN